MSQVHKETLTAVDNALPNRAGLDIEIFGMEGIPEEVIQQHHQRVLQSFHEQRQASSNNANGGPGGNAAKKPKVEDKMTLKERLAAHKAAKAAGQEHGDASTSGGNTPVTAVAAPAPGTFVSPFRNRDTLLLIEYQQPNQSFPQPYTAPPTNGSYGQAPGYSPVQAGLPGFPPQAAPYSAGGYGQQAPYVPPQPYAQPPQPNFQHPLPGSFPPQPAFSPQPFQGHSPYPGQPYQQNGVSPYPSQPGSARAFSGSPAPALGQHTSPPPSHFPKPVHSGTVSLPVAPGLPQRPAIGAPPVSGFQFQQMHQGAIHAANNHHVQAHKTESVEGPPGVTVPVVEPPNPAAIDDLISSAAKASAPATESPVPPANTGTNGAVSTTTKEKTVDEKKEKEKSKATRLVYSDNDISPEERMASLSRYTLKSQPSSVAV
jgi:hypothetical protein